MAFRPELPVDAERDFRLMFDHVLRRYPGHGESLEGALDRAKTAIRALVDIQRSRESTPPRPVETAWRDPKNYGLSRTLAAEARSPDCGLAQSPVTH